MPISTTPIRRTLMRMIFLSSGAVLAVTTAGFCAYEFLTFRQSSVQQLQILSQAIASNSTAALAFDNAEDASVILAAFKADPHIAAAALYDSQGKVFATYPRGLAENEIRDALTNLIFNAVDAMPSGGMLTVHTRKSAEGDRVQIDVSDTGIGMDEDTRRRCLEPFFTTKGERGTGLGLAMVYGMIQRHSAELEINSAAGCGTTVCLSFSAYTSSVVSTTQLAKHPAPSRRPRILLVDDDPMLIKSLQDTLQEDGHQITATHGGQAGIDAFAAAQKRREDFDIVITDLGMPHVDGRKVASTIKSLSSMMPVILLTGWGQRLMAAKDLPPHVDKLLSKPPRLHELRAALAELVS
jgi:CheY-like chemotaxis protein